MKFETLEAAEKHIGTLEGKLTAAEKATEIALKDKENAEAIATDALNKLKIIEDSLPKKITAKVDGKTCEIVFGVDGLSKEELAKDKEKLAMLAKSGSSAIRFI
jgi:hypothetical protein